MHIKETTIQAFDSLKANKLRSFLTLLALVIGVFAVIVSTTAVAVLDNYFKNTMSLMGSDVINVSKTPAVQMGSLSDDIRNRKDIDFRTAERLEDLMQIGRGMSPDEYFNTTKIKFGDEETEPNVGVRGSNENYLANNSYTLEDGRNFTGDDIQYGRNVVIVGKDVQDALFKNEYPLGKEIRFDGKPYTVIGLLESKGQIFGQSFDNFVLIPYTAALNAYGGNRNISIQVRAPEIDFITETVEEITGILRVIRKVNPGENNDFEISTNDSLSGTFDAFTGALYMGGFAIGLITLLGAGIGVMNIMLVSVSERTREIGVRKAVGATRKAIVSQFLMETIFICQLGGIIGMALGIGVGNLMAVWIETEAVIPIWSVAGGFFGMLIVGLIFGVYPAFKAAKLDPIESLRYE
ncbi:MAG: ABC transporter permease [Gracilimonas sp.]|uniref:ABC transporter permease n=1 Tax=Gracilimonas sp. TaxID=1974203 RepID=UPI001B113C3B|nr:ABC transporter permease [Gracilimonas sp.]MBO6586585.1 ABC transporter permease [Gracilimonas sp.]MBO6615242.1 ABC transporter permease [Gracilimonas sp.]